jgi:hypothetical protein
MLVMDEMILTPVMNGYWEIWLLGDEVGAQPNLVFHCDLYWVDVNIASDVVEPTINTRSQTTLILTYLCILLKELFLHSE